MELLAPAGSIGALRQAVHSGADAVYFGLGEHNARIKSADFDTDNLSFWVDYCHLYGVKAYITINTSVKNSEIHRIRELVSIADKSGADAIIATDIAVIIIAKEIAHALPVHISTQAGVHNALGAEFFAKLGAERIVLARESANDDIEAIIKTSGIEVEVFAHGALCVSMSGACLLSSIAGGNSGNRGRCMQPCRKLYSAFGDNGEYITKGYLLSTADLAMQDRVMDMQAMGVSSIKIEGRLKRPEYVGAAVDYYRKLLDGGYPSHIGIRKMFVRGDFVKSYGGNAKVIYQHTPSHIGIPIGTIVSLECRKGYMFAEIESSHPIRKGDGLKIMRGLVECGGAEVTSVTHNSKGNFIVPVSKGVQVGDEVRLTTDSLEIEQLAKLKNRISVSVVFSIKSGESPVITAHYDKLSAQYAPDYIVSDGAVPNGQIESQLRKTKDTPFDIAELTINNEGGYVSKARLNEMRRIVLDKLEEAIVTAYQRKISSKAIVAPPSAVSHSSANVRLIEVQNEAQLDSVSRDDVVIINPIELNQISINALVAKAESKVKQIYIKMPRLNRNGEYKEIMEYISDSGLGLLADNVYAVEYARQNGIPYIAGIGLNIFNSIAFDYFADAKYIVISPEIGADAELLDRGGVIFAAGHLPLMTLAHCPFSVTRGACCSCADRGRTISYKDGTNRFDIVPTICRNCQFTLYNGIVHNLLSKLKGMSYNVYINMLNTTSISALLAKSSTLGHYNNEVI